MPIHACTRRQADEHINNRKTQNHENEQDGVFTYKHQEARLPNKSHKTYWHGVTWNVSVKRIIDMHIRWTNKIVDVFSWVAWLALWIWKLEGAMNTITFSTTLSNAIKYNEKCSKYYSEASPHTVRKQNKTEQCWDANKSIWAAGSRVKHSKTIPNSIPDITQITRKYHCIPKCKLYKFWLQFGSPDRRFCEANWFMFRFICESKRCISFGFQQMSHTVCMFLQSNAVDSRYEKIWEHAF